MRKFGFIFFLVLAFWFFQGVKAAQTLPLNSEISPRDGKVDPRWQEMFENKPTLNQEVETPAAGGEAVNLEKIEEEKKAAPSPLWGDIRARREARKARGEAVKERKEILEKGGTVDPEDKIPLILYNERSRRNARVERRELKEKEEELKKKMGSFTNEEK